MIPATDDSLHLTHRLLPLKQPFVVTTSQTVVPTATGSTVRWALLALVALGITARLVPLILNRNLWIDEAMLALNLVDRSPRQLLEPLDWNQGAPIGFLLLVKGTIELFGPTEWALRLVSFLGSVVGLIGFTWLVRRLLPPLTAVLAVGLFAVSPYLVSYSAECKQYATDAALTVGLFAAALGLLHGMGTWWRWLVLAVAGAAAVWFSHPSVFVLGGIGIALFAEGFAKRDHRRVVACCVTIGCWLASFAVCYFVSLRDLGSNQYLLDYWSGHFLPLPPVTPGALAWLLDHFFDFFAYPGGLGGVEVKAGGIAAVLCIVGIVAIWRDRWTVAVALVVPAVLAVAASGLQRYPVAGRMLLFLVPLMLIALARGTETIVAALRPTQPLAAWVLLGVIVAATTLEMLHQTSQPLRHEQLVPVLSQLRQKWQPGDRVYVYYGAVPAFLFYTREDRFPGKVMLGTNHRQHQTGYRDELAHLAGCERVWLVFSHRHKDEESVIRAYAEGLGHCCLEVRQPGAAAYLFDLRGNR